MRRDDALTAPADCLTLVMPLQALRCYNPQNCRQRTCDPPYRTAPGDPAAVEVVMADAGRLADHIARYQGHP
jgi:hypothetical protein